MLLWWSVEWGNRHSSWNEPRFQRPDRINAIIVHRRIERVWSTITLTSSQKDIQHTASLHGRDVLFKWAGKKSPAEDLLRDPQKEQWHSLRDFSYLNHQSVRWYEWNYVCNRQECEFNVFYQDTQSV